MIQLDPECEFLNYDSIYWKDFFKKPFNNAYISNYRFVQMSSPSAGKCNYFCPLVLAI